MLTYIIDDESISRFLTEQVLRQEEITSPIRPFAAGEEALHFLLSHQPTEVPDVILLDLNMPTMNGWQFLEALGPHAAALACGCHVYVLTSSLATADTARAKDFALVRGIIHKPLNEDEVPRIRYAAR